MNGSSKRLGSCTQEAGDEGVAWSGGKRKTTVMRSAMYRRGVSGDASEGAKCEGGGGDEESVVVVVVAGTNLYLALCTSSRFRARAGCNSGSDSDRWWGTFGKPNCYSTNTVKVMCTKEM